MSIKVEKAFLFFFLLLLPIFLFHPPALCQESASLQQGINLYKGDKYEEAIEALIKARKENPKSTVAAFYLGLAYKQLMDYSEALMQFRDAVTLTPRIKDALVELIDVALHLDKLEEAKKWIEVAENEEIFPAKIAFLKGLVLVKEDKNLEAIESFEKAKSLDKSMTQASDVWIALSYLKEEELKKASERFRTAITQDPKTDMAGFARQYLDMVDERIFLERPFRFTVSLFGQYDDNVLTKPLDDRLAPAVIDANTWAMNSGFSVNYVPRLEGPWLFNAYYAFSSSLHDRHRITHDSFSNYIAISPGYNFGRLALNLNTSYNHSLVRDPGYQKYNGLLRSGALCRVALKQNHLLEIFAGYNWNDFFDPAIVDDEDRDSTGPDTYISWVWLFKKDAFFNLKYQWAKEDTDGINWDNKSHGFSSNLTVPVMDKLKLQLSGGATQRKYQNRHTFFLTEREDDVYTLSGGFTYHLFKRADLVAQITRIWNKSNIGIYDYTRDLYTVGVEYRF